MFLHPRKRRILWFSRGFGRGHAIMDLAILEKARRLRQDFQVQFVSYDAGARTFGQMHQPVIDLDLPAQPPFWEVLVRAAAVIEWTRPALVVCHEEFAPLPLARTSGLPALFITHWFLRPEDLPSQALAYADEVIFVDEPGLFEEPPYVSGRVSYVGPVLRDFQYGRDDRFRARDELGLPRDALVISVFPGSWSEAVVPTVDLVLGAYAALDPPEKRLFWIAGRDFDLIRERVAGRPDIIVREFDPQIDRVMAASDLAITKANYTTIKELTALAIPSISLSCGINPIDDIYARSVPMNMVLHPMEITPEQLAGAITVLLDAIGTFPGEPPLGAGVRSEGAARAAERLAFHIERSRRGERPARPALRLARAVSSNGPSSSSKGEPRGAHRAGV